MSIIPLQKIFGFLAALLFIIIAMFAYFADISYSAAAPLPPPSESVQPSALRAETAASVKPSPSPVPSAAQSPKPLYSGTDYERLFDDAVTHRITIYISGSEWDGLIQDMKDYSAINPRMKTQNYRHANVVYEDEFGKITLDNAGFRTSGNTTRTIPEDSEGYHRSNFCIKFDETFGYANGSKEYNAVAQREFCGLKKLNLKWNMWTDRSHIRELYACEQLNAIGIMAPRASLAALAINIDGKNVGFGVYTIIEPIDKKFLTKRIGTHANDGNLYKCLSETTYATLTDNIDAQDIGVKDWKANYRPSYDLQTNKDMPYFGDIKSFIENINNLSDTDFADYIEENFDVDSFLRLLAMDSLLGSFDNYRTMANNYYLYFCNLGGIVMIPYDYNACLGGGWEGDPYWNYKDIAKADIYTSLDLSKAFTKNEARRPLLDRILAIDDYQQRYEYYLKTYIDSGLFSYDSFVQKFNSLKALYEPYVCSETHDEGEEMELTNEEWYFKTRIASVNKQLGS